MHFNKRALLACALSGAGIAEAAPITEGTMTYMKWDAGIAKVVVGDMTYPATTSTGMLFNLGAGTTKGKFDIIGSGGLRISDGPIANTAPNTSNGLLWLYGDSDGNKIVSSKNQGGTRDLRFIDKQPPAPAGDGLERERVRITAEGKVGIGTGASPWGFLDVKNNLSRVTLSKGSAGLGDALFQIEGHKGRNFTVNAIGGGLITEFGPNYAVSDGNGTDRFALNPLKYAPYIRMSSEDGSISLVADIGTPAASSTYRQLQPNQVKAGLVVDKAGRVGIGMSTPNVQLEVSGEVRVTGGNVRIGATSTAPALFLNGGPQIPLASMQNKFNLPPGPTTIGPATLSFISTNWNNGNGIGFLEADNVASPIIWMYDYGGKNAFTVAKKGYQDGVGGDPTNIDAALTPLFQIRVDGSVGIGTVSPKAKLDVNGSANVSGDATVGGTLTAGTITTTRWNIKTPDYVFEKGYELQPLHEVKAYVDRHKHLPDVPSAKELDSKGMNVAEMNLTLLKKVEELTLYLIDLKREVDSLKTGRGRKE